jgi:hypothetical protein
MIEQSNDKPADDWAEYRRLILSELRRLHTENQRLSSKIDNLRDDVLSLKIKASLWGAAAGALPALIAIVWSIVSSIISR